MATSILECNVLTSVDQLKFCEVEVWSFFDQQCVAVGDSPSAYLKRTWRMLVRKDLRLEVKFSRGEKIMLTENSIFTYIAVKGKKIISKEKNLFMNIYNSVLEKKSEVSFI